MWQTAMGAVHELLLAQGKADALKGDVRRPVIEAAAAYLSDEIGGTGWLYSGWCQAALPHKRLADEQVWEVTSDVVRLVVRPGLRPRDGIEGDLISVGVPYGACARLILLYLQSEALRTGDPEVRLGRSMRAVGGRTVTIIRDQAERLSRCSLVLPHLSRAAREQDWAAKSDHRRRGDVRAGRRWQVWQVRPNGPVVDNFRALFLNSLALALAVYPAARVDIGDAGLTLWPSPPPVPTKTPARQGRLDGL